MTDCEHPVLLKMAGNNGTDITFCVDCGELESATKGRQVINQWELKRHWTKTR